MIALVLLLANANWPLRLSSLGLRYARYEAPELLTKVRHIQTGRLIYLHGKQRRSFRILRAGALNVWCSSCFLSCLRFSTYVGGEDVYRNTHVRWWLMPKPPKMLKKLMSEILIFTFVACYVKLNAYNDPNEPLIHKTIHLIHLENFRDSPLKRLQYVTQAAPREL